MAHPTDMTLFTSLPENAFSARWLDGSTPRHPEFDDTVKIDSIVAKIKHGIRNFALEACRLVLQTVDPAEESEHILLTRTLSAQPILWWATLMVQRYGVVYFMSRIEAQSKFSHLVNQYPAETDAIDKFLRSHNAAAIRIINYAVHGYITRGGLRVEYSTLCVPLHAIAAIGPDHVVVRMSDFVKRTASEVLAIPSPMWDLHDFAHLSCATLSKELYGNKYQTHLVQLPKCLTALIRSPGMRTATGPKLSDGLVFSEILTKMYTSAVADVSKHAQQTYASLCTDMAHTLAEYLLGQRALEHLSTGEMIIPQAPITPVELAVLVQNKSYELPASEMEQRLLTRGGHEGAEEDVLQPMSARERVAWLAKNRSWGYFEVRNTIKHRAHKQAYAIVCEVLIAQTKDEWERMLLREIRANLSYKDWEEGKRLILWDLLSDQANTFEGIVS